MHTEQQVAKHAAADSCETADDRDAEHVEVAAHTDQGARDGKGENAGELQQLKDELTHAKILCRRGRARRRAPRHTEHLGRVSYMCE